MNTFKGRDFLKLLDFTPAEIGASAGSFGRSEGRTRKTACVHQTLCEGKNFALIFEKTSTRTRCCL